MRIITTEEHTVDVRAARAGAERSTEISPPHFSEAYSPDSGLAYSPTGEQLTDLGENRLRDMDAGGIDVQVISNLSTQNLPADVPPELVTWAR